LNETTDHIQRSIALKAPRARVWKALTDAEEFGRWFGVRLEGKRFAIGERIQGPVTYPGYEHIVCEFQIERIEPEWLFSWRWHPAAIDPAVDYSKEPTTLVVFELHEVEGGTRLSVVESGFDKVPSERRLKAFRLNSEGWEEQMASVDKHVSAG
jgi:uncharacterized protein YndB with AHSA1/START domain